MEVVMKSIIRGILLSLALVFTFSTCENPVGLGAKVNTEKPVIRNAGDENQPGAFIQGNGNRIWLEVEQEFGIEKVFMEVEYVNKTTGATEKKTIEAYFDEEKQQWYVDLDTSNMEDGTIKAWVTAVDINGNTTTTTDIVYFVKNTPPQIKLNMPLVDGDNWDNLPVEDGIGFLDNLVNTDPLYLGFDLMGLATDNYGIEKGYPKIMIWPAPDQDFSIQLGADGQPMPNDERYGTWRSLIVPNERDGLTATKFSWPMVYLVPDASAPGGYRQPVKGEKIDSLNPGRYRLKIVIKDLFGNENFYPNRTDTTRGPDNPSPKFIEISYKASDVPIIQYTDYPQYYNAVNDLDVFFTVSSQTEITSIMASIVNTNDAEQEKILGGPYSLNDYITSNGSTGAIYRYKLIIPAAQAKTWINKEGFPISGILFVKIQAVAGDKTGPNTYQNFIYDDKPPSVIIDRPVNLTNKVASGLLPLKGGDYEIWYPDPERPKWVTGSITVAGAVDDNLTLIKDVYFHIGKLGDDDPTANRELIYNTESNWTNSNVQYTDKYSDSSITWSGSLYSWSCTFIPFDNEYKTTPEGILRTQKHTDLKYSFPANTYSETESTGKKRFYLPFYVKVVDSANNYKVIHYKLSVDPLLDEPIVTITQPEVKGGVIPIVGGTVRVSGYAEDNYWMHTVLMRVQKWGGNSAGTVVGGYPDGTTLDNNYYIPKTTPPTLPFYKDSSVSSYPRPMKADGITPDIDGWFMAEKQGDSNNVNWYALINQNLELDPAPLETTVKVIVEVVAIDCAQSDTTHNTVNTIGPVEKLELKFSKDVPMIDKVTIKKSGLDDRPFTEGIKASDLFSFSFDVEAINNINTLTVRVNGASTPITLINGTNNQTVTGWSITGQTPSAAGKNKRNVTVSINSIADTITSLSVPGFNYGKTGTLTLEVTAVDATENRLSTTNTFVIGIDNFYPTAVINTLNIASDNPASAKYYFVEGTAQDYPTTGTNLVQGLDKVLIYFERANITYDAGNNRRVTGNGTFVRPNGANANIGTDFITYPKVIYNEGPASTGITSPNRTDYTRFPKLNSGVPLTSPSAMVIDTAENGGTLDVDLDGTYGEIWNGQSSAFKEFGARVAFTSTTSPAITSSWTDGPYIVHYMILDQAGNATHYQNDIYLENKKPRITNINFGTDIDGNGSVANTANLQEYLYSTDEVINAPSNSAVYGVKTLNNPYFRIRGNRFAVKFTVANGNGNKGATVTYVTQGANISAATMERGRVYTIVNQGNGWSYTDFTKYGAPNNIEGTTFVSAGPATVSSPPSGTPVGTPGTVTTYTSRPDGSHRFPLNMSASQTDGTITITNFNNISDSEKDTNGEILSTKHNERLFILKVYDTTTSDSSPDGWDQLADAMLVKVDIDNQDGKAPSIEVLPFGYEYNVDPSATPPLNNPANYAAKAWKLLIDSDYNNYNKNIGMNRIDNADVKGGYVQYSYLIYPAINPTGTADISGKIKFLGKVEDNQRIESIWVKIDGYSGGSYFQIAQTSNFQIIPVTNSAGDWVFTVLDKNYQTLEYGHSLSWEFMWDSSKHTKVADNGVNITFEVRDATYATTPANHSKTASKAVNIVPYISEIETLLSPTYYSPSVFNRSALGGYPVRQGEEIKIKGFNLGTDVKINSTSLTSVSTVTEVKGGITITSIKGTIPDVESGPLVVTVNGVASFNNNNTRKQKNAPYNQEPNGVNNNILDNSRYIYVWNTGWLLNTDIPYVSNPYMRMTDNGDRLLSYGYYNGQSTGRVRVRKNNANLILGTAYSNRMLYTTIGITKGNTSFYTLGSEISSQNNRGFQLGKSNAAGTGNAAASTPNDNNTGNTTATGSIKLYDMTSSNPDRFRIPRIAVQSTATTRTDTNADRVLISYFDNESTDKDVRIIYGTVGANNTAGANDAASNVTANITSVAYATQPTAVGLISVLVADNNTEFKSSMYTAVGLLKNGEPLIAWYDNSRQRLMFSFIDTRPGGTTTANGFVTTTTGVNSNAAAGTWQGNAAVIAEGMGTHVDMAVDKDDNVHLAYYSDDGGLWYTFIPSAEVKKKVRDPSLVKPVRVDTFLSAGTKIMINVRNNSNTPYISYAHAGFPGTRHSIRVAWLVSSVHTADGTNADDTFTGKWEVMTVPVRKDVIPNIDEFVCNGVPTSGSWTAPGGGSTLTHNSGLDESILVGFFTNLSYEGAVLRDKILTVPDILKKE
jgi:large repetitive protein